MVNIGDILGIAGAAVVVISVLPIIAGFGTTGVAAGSIAAGVQSGIGNVAAGSAFSTLTSLGMKGVLVKGACAGSTSLAAGAVIKKKDNSSSDSD